MPIYQFVKHPDWVTNEEVVLKVVLSFTDSPLNGFWNLQQSHQVCTSIRTSARFCLFAGVLCTWGALLANIKKVACL